MTFRTLLTVAPNRVEMCIGRLHELVSKLYPDTPLPGFMQPQPTGGVSTSAPRYAHLCEEAEVRIINASSDGENLIQLLEDFFDFKEPKSDSVPARSIPR